MIMRVTWGKIRPGKWDTFERLWNDLAVETQNAQGLLGRWLLLDSAQKDAGYSLTLWDSNDDFENYDTPRPVYSEMQECFVGEFVTTSCEVRGSQMAGLKKLLSVK